MTRAAIVSIPQPWILALVTGKRVLENVPEGATLTGAWFERRAMYDHTEKAWLMIRIEHPSLEPTPVGGRLPFVKGKFRRP
jgi:hypothetical protein